MASKFSDEPYLERLARTLLGSENCQASAELLSNEAALHALLENLQSRSMTLGKKSFCIVLLLLNHWKQSQNPCELPSIFYTYIEVIDQFIYFSSLGSGSIRESFTSASKVLKEHTNPEPVLYFLPHKFFPERRLYRVSHEDLTRIINEQAWNRFPDPHRCEYWVKLPSWYDSVEIGSKATLRMSYVKENSVSRGGTDSLSGKDNVAQMIFELRTNRKRYRTGATLQRGSSIFKPKLEVKGVSPTSRKASSQGLPESEDFGSPLIVPGLKLGAKLELLNSPDSKSPSQYEVIRKVTPETRGPSYQNKARGHNDLPNTSNVEQPSEVVALRIGEAGSTQETSFFSKPESLFESLSASGAPSEQAVRNLGISKHVRRYTLNLPRSRFLPK